MVETMLVKWSTSLFFNQIYNSKVTWLLSPSPRLPLFLVSMPLIPFLLTCLFLSSSITLTKSFPRFCWSKTMGEDFLHNLATTIKKKKVQSSKPPDRPSNILCWMRVTKGNRGDMRMPLQWWEPNVSRDILCLLQRRRPSTAVKGLRGKTKSLSSHNTEEITTFGSGKS